MARQRIINPEFWLDEDIAYCDFTYRLFYIGTWNFSDDYGVIENAPQKLKAQIFPYDDVSVQPIIDRLTEKKKYIPFEVDGKKYLFIKNFLKYQKVDKPSKFRYPSPPQALLDEHSTTALGLFGSEEKRSKEKRSKEKRSEYSQSFEDFWKLYPKKVGKPKTFELWNLLTEPEQKKILEDVPKRGEDDKWINGYVKDPERYIKYRQWEDEIIKPKKRVEKIVDKF